MKDDISKSLVTIKPLIDGLSKAISSATSFAVGLGKVLVDNLDRVATYAIVAASAFAGKFVAGLVAARLATVSLSGALVILRGALIKTGIGALIVAAGELVYQFLRLIKGAGSFGGAMLILKDVALGVWDKIKAGGDLLSANLGLIFNGIADSFTVNVAAPILLSWGRLLDTISSSPLGEAMGLEGGNENLMGSMVSDMIESQTDSFVILNERAKAARKALDSPIEGVQELRDTLQSLDEAGSGIDVSSWFGKSPQKPDSKTSTQESPLKKLQAQLKLEQELIGKSEEYARVRQALGESYDRVEPKQIANLENQIRLIEEAKQAEQDRLSIMGTVESSMEEGFMSMIDGTASVKDAFKEMARQIIAELMRILVVKRMVSGITTALGFADGGAFSGGSQVQAYADGGVVGGPTTFPMSGGKTGLMGEAGPEAIMPLKRGANGKLGVQMEGNSGGAINIVQNFSFAANGDDSVKKLIAQAAPQIAQMTQKQIMDSRRRGGAMKSTFG